MILTPGTISYDQWLAIYHGAPFTLDPACRPGIAQSAAAVARIARTGSST